MAKDVKARYAIVRVDSCPPRKEIDAQFVCFPKDNICSGCRYGDTKEQLVAKMATAIFRSEVKSYKKYYGITPTRIITKDAETQYLKIAKEIVEFLGVEE